MVRYKPSQFTKKELEKMVTALGLGAGFDFVTGGGLNKYGRKAAVQIYRTVVRPLAGVTARAAVPATVSVARSVLGASRLLMFNPYIAGATAIYVGLHERERIKEMLEQGYEFMGEEGVPMAAEYFQERLPSRQREPDYSGGRSFGVLPTQMRKKQPSKFNQAVKTGMAVIKKSTSYGGKGKIKPAKKAFTVVTKLASAKSKKRKAPKSGIKRKIWNAMRGY